MKRLQIQHLREAGLSVERTAAASGVSPRTVERVSSEDPISDPKACDESARRRVGRPSPVARFEEQVRAWLKADPGMTSVAILERLRGQGYEGGKSAVYQLARRLRPPKRKDGIVRFEAVPGEFAQHDFGQLVVRYADGTQERIRFFASQLQYSRLVHVRLVEDETAETVCHSLVEAYTYFGGMPLLGVFDNARSIVTKREGKHVTWQDTFAWFTVECGFSPHVTWPYRPQEKGGVENLVGFVKSNFFKVHEFRDRADLEEKLAAWHTRVNDERPSRATGDVPRARMMLEAERLRPLRLDPHGYTLRYARVVRTDGFVEVAGKRYFAGYAHIGRALTVRVGEREILIYAEEGPPIVHPRFPANGKYSVLDGQREELLVKPGARPYVKRQLLMDTCPAAEWFMTELRHRRPDQWQEEVDALFTLLEMHGEIAVRDALIEAARRGVVGSEYVVAILHGHACSEEVK